MKATLYTESRIMRKHGNLIVERDSDGYLFSGGKYHTKIRPEDLPEWFVYGYMYKRYGYISAKGVKHLLYNPNYTFNNHLHKYDTLYLSYDMEIVLYETDETNTTWYKGYDHIISGALITEFLEAASKYSAYDVREIQKELEIKRAWYFERNPE